MNTGRRQTISLLLRWLGRLLSLLLLGFILMFAVGEGGFNPLHLAPREMLLALFFPVGMCAGLIVGWFHEAWGGGITVVGLAGFYAAHWIQSGRFPGGPWFLILATPGFVFLASWAYRRLSSSVRDA